MAGHASYMIDFWEETDEKGRMWVCSEDKYRYISTITTRQTQQEIDAHDRHMEYIRKKQEKLNQK